MNIFIHFIIFLVRDPKMLRNSLDTLVVADEEILLHTLHLLLYSSDSLTLNTFKTQ